MYTDKEGIPGWWTFRLMSPTPQSAWDVPRKTKKCGQKILCYCYTARKKTSHRTRFFEKYTYVRVLLIDGGAVQKKIGRSTKKNKTNNWLTTFSNFSGEKVAVPREHENYCCRFATPQWQHQRLDRRVVDFGIRGDARVMAELRNVVRKKNGGTS